jgi:probable rRNA maturation factor
MLDPYMAPTRAIISPAMAEAARRSFSISILVEAPFRGRLDSRALRRLAARVLRAEGVLPPAEVDLVVADDETLRELNRRYRSLDEPTDVLSFGHDPSADSFVTPPDGVRRLGEVILSYPTAERQAREAGRSVQEEAAHLVVHGLLHLLSYDHADPEDERRMRAREEALLQRQAH